MDNVVTYVYAKFGSDQLWNEKALADRKSDNNNTNKQKKNNVGGHWGPGPKTADLVTVDRALEILQKLKGVATSPCEILISETLRALGHCLSVLLKYEVTSKQLLWRSKSQ